MMILRLVRRPDGVPAGLSECVLQAAGSTIGRAPDCDLVLDDPLRLVSRRHAWIVPQGDGSAKVRCISTSAPLLVNGESLEPGGERLVGIGDRIRIGGFEVLLDPAEPAGLATSAAPVMPDIPLSSPSPVVATAAASPVAAVPTASAPAALVPEAPERRRIDRWFDLDTAADPLGAGSPLPAADEGAPAPVRAPRAVVPPTGAAPAPAAALTGAAQAAAMPLPGRAKASPVAAPRPAATPMPRPAPEARTPTPVRAARHAGTADDTEALRQAFLRGARLDPSLALDLGPAWMEHVGALLRLATDGTVDLLRSRAVAKRGMRAEGTRIAARENNLLKFTPDSAEALRLMLSLESRPGFLDPADAMRDAQEDLQLHQLAMVAGMRAAVFDLISRLGPEAVEQEQGPPQGLARWSAVLRDAALWRRHCHMHARLLENLDDTFEAIFGREFVRAYEAQARRTPVGDDEPI
jgi:type VI secretion system FHA domain protein